MPPTERSFKYDAYISYASADRPWALMLSKALENQNIEVFLDESRLQAGDDWNKKLLQSLKASQHIVILWSRKAASSHWVNIERLRFEIISEEDPAERRVIFLLLEGEPGAASHRHWVTLLSDAEAYAGLGDDADGVDQDLWQRAVRKVRDAVLDIQHTISVPLAILTITQEQLDELDPAQMPNFVERPLRDYLRTIGIRTKDDLRPYYGSLRTDWRPFGGEYDTWSMLSQIRNDINGALREAGLEQARFRWEPVGDGFWSDDFDTFTREVSRFQGNSLSVVVVDPIALYDEGVRARFKRFIEELRYSTILFILPTRMPAREAPLYLSEVIEQLATPLFTRLSDSSSRWEVVMGDEVDILDAMVRTVEQDLILEEGPSKFSDSYSREQPAAKDLRGWRRALRNRRELKVQQSAERAREAGTVRPWSQERKERRLEELYSQARELHQKQEWQAVIDVFDQIHADESAYPDPEGLLATAQEARAPQPDVLNSETIFVSYGRKDWDEFVEPLVIDLRQRGFKIWIDQHVIRGGDDWYEEIQRALETCERMVLCVSPDSLKSKYVQREYRYFSRNEKWLLPLICRKARLPWDLEGTQYVTYQQRDLLIGTLGEWRR